MVKITHILREVNAVAMNAHDLPLGLPFLNILLDTRTCSNRVLGAIVSFLS